MKGRLSPKESVYATLVEFVVAASEEHSHLWLPSEVASARKLITKKNGDVVRLADLYDNLGKSRADSLVQSILANQERFVRSLAVVYSVDALESECHRCGLETSVSRHGFALARITAGPRDWSGTAVTALVSLVTIPLLGSGLVHGPSRQEREKRLHFVLQLCPNCERSKKNLLGRLKLAKADYAQHPRWEIANREGFVRLITDV